MDFLLLFRNLPFHFLNHRQFFLALFSVFGIDISGNLLAISTHRGVFPLPEVVVDLVHTAGSPLTVLGLVGLEAALVGVLFPLLFRHRGISFANLVVDFYLYLQKEGVFRAKCSHISPAF